MELKITNTKQIDDPGRYKAILFTIKKKESLYKLYFEGYKKFIDCLENCPSEGLVLEIGSGGGFLKEVIPQVITTDIIPYEGVDRVIDARKLPFEDGSVKAILMHYVFHHIPNVELFLSEAQRCLKKGGRIFVIDPHKSLLSAFIYNCFHHEQYLPKTKSWDFTSSGPLSDANAALAWVVFQRDRSVFNIKFTKLKLLRYNPHSPLRYWLTGGQKNWNLLPSFMFPVTTWIDAFLAKVSHQFCTFTDVEIEKIE